MADNLYTAPTVEPVTLSDAKVHLRVDHNADDGLITALIKAAREMAEQKTGVCLASQTRQVTFDEFPDAFPLRPPVSSITQLSYIDKNGVEQTLAAPNYTLDNVSSPNYLVPAYGLQWPETKAVPNAVNLRYVSGYATCPESVRSWILLTIGTLYAQRETLTNTNFSAMTHYWDRLLDSVTVFQGRV